MAVDVELLTPQARVRFPGQPDVVTLIAVTPGPFWEFYFDGPAGPGKQVLAESELDGIEISKVPIKLRFDGEPLQFRLGVEARRIDIAFAYEMAAVAVSNIQPLPHQLEAVYDCFLREPRLRFLLADDPGAGKTIMAGLYMKELILRRSGDRILVVTPANLRPQWIRELAERFQLDFVQLGATHFDASLTENPWDQFDRIVVSRDFLRTERARAAFDAAENTTVRALAEHRMPRDRAIRREAGTRQLSVIHGVKVLPTRRADVDHRGVAQADAGPSGSYGSRRAKSWSTRMMTMIAVALGPECATGVRQWALAGDVVAVVAGDRQTGRRRSGSRTHTGPGGVSVTPPPSVWSQPM